MKRRRMSAMTFRTGSIWTPGRAAVWPRLLRLSRACRAVIRIASVEPQQGNFVQAYLAFTTRRRCAHSMRMIIQEALASSKAAFPPSG
jgi:hypothetical protein